MEENMVKLSRLSILVVVAIAFLSACSPPGGGGGGTTADPIVAHWVLSTVTDPLGASQTPLNAGIAIDLIFNADKSFVVGQQMGVAWGGPLTRNAVGTWTSGGSGTYTYTAYPSGGTGSSADTGTAVLSGSTFTVGPVNGPSGVPGYKLTFTKSTVSISSSDPLKGTWVLNSVTDKNNFTSAPSSLSIAEDVVFEGDSSFFFGQQASGGTQCGVGIWTPGSPGSYSFTVYPAAGTSAGSSSGSLGGSILTVPNINIGSGLDPYTFSFTKYSTTISSTDPALGAWALSSVTDSTGTNTPLTAGLQQVVIFQNDGSLLFGSQMSGSWGNSSDCGVGFWTPGAPGSCTYTVYPANSTTGSTGTATVAGSILTVAGITGPHGSTTLTFTKM
jgi:hypothetical protein